MSLYHESGAYNKADKWNDSYLSQWAPERGGYLDIS